MGLVRNLKLLFSDSLLHRMSELEDAQDLLEEHVAGRLDSMKQYSARVAKRDRDARRGAVTNDQGGSNGLETGHINPRVAALVARRARRMGHPRLDLSGG